MIIGKDALGTTMKNARNVLGLTQEQLAERLGVSERYIKQLENGYKKPSFPLLHRIICELNIQADSIFYPEKPSKDSRIENLVRMLHNYDERSMIDICAIAKAIWENQPRE